MPDAAPRFTTPEPFTVDVQEHQLVDLDERLRRWRPSTGIDNAGWAYGAAPSLLKDLVDHWRQFLSRPDAYLRHLLPDE